MGLELTDTGFDASVLSEFRARLAADDQVERLLQQMLARLRERGLLARSGRQRTDATHVLAAARELNRLELVTETLRGALETLAAAAPAWLQGFLPEEWYARYGQRARDWRLPKAEAARSALAVIVGADVFMLLEAVYGSSASVAVAGPGGADPAPAMAWLQQDCCDQDGLRWRDKNELPPGALAIGSPYDPQARYGSKRGVGWRGYKTHCTETCKPDRPHPGRARRHHRGRHRRRRHRRRPSRRPRPRRPAA